MLRNRIDRIVKLIRFRREQANLTQVELAQRLGISHRNLQRIEAGHLAPSVETLINLSKVFNFNFFSTLDDPMSFENPNSLNHIRKGSWQLKKSKSEVLLSESAQQILGVNGLNVVSVADFLQIFNDSTSKKNIEKVLRSSIQVPLNFECVIEASREPVGRRLLHLKISDSSESLTSDVLRGTIEDFLGALDADMKLRADIASVGLKKDSTDFGAWLFNIQSNVLHWSDQIYEIFEVDRANFRGRLENFIELIHPDDRDKVAAAYEASLINRSPYEIEHRIVIKDGQIKWVLEKCETAYSLDGKPVVSAGYAFDISQFR